MSWGSIVIITVAVLLVIMGIRGTQHTVLPFLFGTSSSSGGSTTTVPLEAVPGVASTGGNPIAVGLEAYFTSGKCDNGYATINIPIPGLYLCTPAK